MDEVQSGYLCEVFSGIQGEGLLVGERQIFVRLAGCNLSCRYCDTPHARTLSGECRAEEEPGSRIFANISNPLALSDALQFIRRLQKFPGMHEAVAVTGGEPLMQPAFVANLAGELKALGFRVLLETNGSLPDALGKVLPVVDIVSMDIKLPGATGGPDLMSQHEEFLGRLKGVQVYVKVVLTSDVSTEELLAAAKMVVKTDSAIPLILQPVTPAPGIVPPPPLQVLEWQEWCKRLLRDVRVIPQCHRILGQL